MKEAVGVSVSNRRWYISSVFVTFIGNSCSFIICGKVTFDAFGITSVFALVLLLEQVKGLFLSALAGNLVEKFSPKRIAVICDFFLSAMGAIFSYLAWTGQTRWAVLLTFGMINLVKPFYNAAIFSLTKEIVSDDDIFLLNSRGAAAQQLGYFIGLAVTALLITHVSPAYLLMIDALTYLLSGVFLSRCRSMVAASLSPLSHKKSKLQGFLFFDNVKVYFNSLYQFVLSNPGILKYLLLIGFQINLIVAYNSCVFKLISERYPDSPTFLSGVEAVYAGTIVLVALIFAKYDHFRRSVSRVRIWMLVQGLCFSMLTMPSSIFVLSFLVGLFALSSSVIFPTCFSELQKLTTINTRGKVSGLKGMLQSLIAIPMLLVTSFLTDVFGLGAAYLLLAFVCFFWSLYLSLFCIVENDGDTTRRDGSTEIGSIA